MNNDNQPNKPFTRSWVWACSEDSIEHGRISILAIAETLAAVALYWWLATHFASPWLAYVGLVAAPLLLLRSPESIDLGVAMLQRYNEHSAEDFSRLEKISLSLMISLLTGLTVYWLASVWLPGYSGWDLFWRAAVLGWIAFAVAGTVAGTVAGAGAGAGTVAFAGAGAGAVILFMPSFTLGILLRGLLIRWIATLRHLPEGLAQLPQNWRENLLVIDLLHPPELLPQANRVDSVFTVKGLLAKLPTSSWDNKTVYSILLVAWYLPALAYRWSLKASAWLWWPLALALKPPFAGLDGKAIREQTACSVGGTRNYLTIMLPAVLLLWLILSAFPLAHAMLPLLPRETADASVKLLALITPPAFGIRYVALWLGSLLALAFWWRSDSLKASFGDEVKSVRNFSALSDGDQDRFLQLARPIERLRLLLIFTLLILGESTAASLFHPKNRS